MNYKIKKITLKANIVPNIKDWDIGDFGNVKNIDLEHKDEIIERLLEIFGEVKEKAMEYYCCFRQYEEYNRLLALIKYTTDIYDNLPKYIKGDTSIIKGINNIFANYVYNYPERITLAPFPNDARIKKAEKIGWIKATKRNPDCWQYVPQELRETPEIEENIIEEVNKWVALINNKEMEYWDCPYKGHPLIRDTQLSHKEEWVEAIKSDIGNYELCPIKHLPEIKNALIDGWANGIIDGELEYIYCPVGIKRHPTILKALHEMRWNKKTPNNST